MVNQDIDSLASAALTLSQSEGIMYSVTALESHWRDLLNDTYSFTMKFQIIKRKYVQISVRKKIL